MNKQLRNFLKLGILIVGISLLLLNCEKETLTLEKENTPITQNSKDLVGYIVKPDSVFKANKKIKDYISKTFSSKSKNNSKAIVSDIYRFSIDTSKVQIIVASSYQSYTFYVERENSTPDILENYVLNIFNDGGYNQLLVSYPVTEINGERTYNINTATARYINDPSLLAKGVQCANASEEIIAWDPDAGVCVDYNCKAPTGNGQHAPGDACSATGEDRAHTECSGGWVVTGCINYGGSGSGFGGGGTGSSGGGSSGGVSNGSSGGDTNVNATDNLDNPNIGVVPFDILPTFDEIFIDQEFKDNPCLNSVYEKMGKTKKFKEYLTNFEPEFSVAHLRFKYDENFGSNHSDNTTALAITEPPLAGNGNNVADYNINISFNGDTNLDASIHNKPKLVIAVAFIHEMIHAEVFRKMLSAAQQGHLNANQYTTQNRIDYINSLRNNFPGIYDYYVERWRPNWGHEQMAQHYISIITNALKEYDNNQHTQEQYEAIAWLGLEGTIAWNNLTQAERDNIHQTRTNFIDNDTNKCN